MTVIDAAIYDGGNGVQGCFADGYSVWPAKDILGNKLSGVDSAMGEGVLGIHHRIGSEGDQ